MAYGFQRYQIREEVARVFGLFESLATDGTTTTIVDLVGLARFADDYWINACILLKYTADEQSPMGQYAWVTDFVRSTGTLTFSPAFTAVPGDGDAYQLYKHVSPVEINLAITHTCVGAELVTSLTPSTTTTDYDVTAAKALRRRQQIIGVWVRPDGEQKIPPHQVQGWQFEDAEGVLTLRLPYLLNTNDQLWIHYYAGEDLDEECEIINLPLLLMRARVVVYLIENLIANQDAGGVDKWGTMLRYWVEQRDNIEKQHQRVATKIQKHRWQDDIIPTGISTGEKALGLTPNYGNSFADYP